MSLANLIAARDKIQRARSAIAELGEYPDGVHLASAYLSSAQIELAFAELDLERDTRFQQVAGSTSMNIEGTDTDGAVAPEEAAVPSTGADEFF